jgi:hypothetical protein
LSRVVPKDLRVWSPSRAYRLEAIVSPGFRFTYTLYEEATARAVWRRDAPAKESWASGIFVDDDGRAVLHVGGLDGYLIVQNRRGADIGGTGLLGQAITREEAAVYARQTTAGWRWAGLSHWYFTRIGARPCFALRTYWGRRVVLGVDNGEPIADEGAARVALDQAERAMVVAELRRAAGWAKTLGEAATDEEWWDSGGEAAHERIARVEKIRGAAHLAGCHRVREVISELKSLERIARVRVTSSGGPYPAGMLILRYALRPVVHLSLRRLRVEPAGHPATRILLNSKDVTDRVPLSIRASLLPSLRSGVPQLEVLERLGAPDDIPTELPSEDFEPWDYDVDGDAPCTMRLHWVGEKAKLGAIERLVPPIWQDDTRDRELAL